MNVLLTNNFVSPTHGSAPVGFGHRRHDRGHTSKGSSSVSIAWANGKEWLQMFYPRITSSDVFQPTGLLVYKVLYGQFPVEYLCIYSQCIEEKRIKPNNLNPFTKRKGSTLDKKYHTKSILENETEKSEV